MLPPQLTIGRFASPLGELLVLGIAATDTVSGLWITGEKHAPDIAPEWIRDDRAFAKARQQLAEFFAGTRTTFDLMLEPAGTPFQQRVWQALREIPYGTTTSYGALARAIQQPTASRAVGLANGRNPLSIIVPCHRVIGANGALTGYGGGLTAKRWLLDHEARISRSR